MRSKGRQPISYWNVSEENRYGERIFSDPVVFKGRWEDRNEEVQLPTGDTTVSRSIVFIPGNIGAQIGGYLAKGDHTGVMNPVAAGAGEIQSIIEVPSLRTNQVERRAIL